MNNNNVNNNGNAATNVATDGDNAGDALLSRPLPAHIDLFTSMPFAGMLQLPTVGYLNTKMLRVCGACEPVHPYTDWCGLQALQPTQGLREAQEVALLR